MTKPSPSMRKLALRLMQATSSEAAASSTAREHRGHPVTFVFERLRATLSRFAGPDGFAALQRRSLALARQDHPALGALRLGANGRMENFDEAIAGAEQASVAVDLAAHLLDLLEAFIGEPLTLRLVRDGWPELDSESNDTQD